LLSRFNRSHQRATPAEEDVDGGERVWRKEEWKEESETEGGGRRSERKATPVEAKRINVVPSRKPARSKITSCVKRGKDGKAGAGASVVGAMLCLRRIFCSR
jgi:hypothetical protein